jgi:hypothetical protein
VPACLRSRAFPGAASDAHTRPLVRPPPRDPQKQLSDLMAMYEELKVGWSPGICRAACWIASVKVWDGVMM